MQRSKAVIWLSAIVAVLAAVAAGVGLFAKGGSGPFSFITLRGESVRMYGRGLYRYDTLFTGALNRGADAVTLVVGIPLLVISLFLYWRGSLRGGLLLTGVLAYFLYVYASLALGTAYNSLFLLYIALFAAALFAFVRAFTAVELPALPGRLSPATPYRGVALFLLACGVVTLGVWLGMGLLPAIIRGEPPKLLDSSTTVVTDVLDLRIITPSCFLAGFLLLRRRPLGYVMAFALLGILVILGPAFVAETISQLSAGVSFTPGEIVGPIGGFGLLSLAAIGLMIALLRTIAVSSLRDGDADTVTNSPSRPRSNARAGSSHTTIPSSPPA